MAPRKRRTAKVSRVPEIEAKKFWKCKWKKLADRAPGWFCAQRRPGRALGWLQVMYQNPNEIPEILLIVDDDTSLVRNSS
jgi:hypothetical protein